MNIVREALPLNLGMGTLKREKISAKIKKFIGKLSVLLKDNKMIEH